MLAYIGTQKLKSVVVSDSELPGKISENGFSVAVNLKFNRFVHLCVILHNCFVNARRTNFELFSGNITFV